MSSDEKNMESQSVEESPSAILGTFMSQQSSLKMFISRYIRRPQDIDDIAQETFIRAFKAEQKGTIEYPKAYIYRIARNLALETLAKKSTRLTDFIEDSVMDHTLISETNVEEQVNTLERLDKVKLAIAELPPQCQKVFIMHKVYGFKYKEIAHQLGVSVSTVEKHIMTGLKKCRDSVRRQEAPAKIHKFSPKVSAKKGFRNRD